MCFSVDSVILFTAEEGWITCPICKKKLLRVEYETEAENLPLRCPRCKREYITHIRRDRSAMTPES